MASVTSVAQLASVSAFASTASLRSSSAKSAVVSVAPISCSAKSEEAPSRRVLAAGAAALVLAAFASPAMAIGPAAEPPIEKKGRKETVKKYASICVSQPTASVCHG